MSRSIDVSDPSALSQDDIDYLAARNQLPAELIPEPEILGEEGDPPEPTGPGQTTPDAPVVAPTPDSDNDPSIPDLEDLPYVEWPKDELKKELDDRGIEYKSRDTVADLASALTADDEADEAEDSEG